MYTNMALQWLYTSQDGLSSAWHTPSESTLGAKTLSSTDMFLVVTVTHKSPFDKSSIMRRDSGGMEDMSNPPTVNWRSINSIYHQPTERCWIGLLRQVGNFVVQNESLLQSKSRHTNTTIYSSTDHVDDFPVTVSTVEVYIYAYPVTDGPLYIEYYYVSVLGACI